MGSPHRKEFGFGLVSLVTKKHHNTTISSYMLLIKIRLKWPKILNIIKSKIKAQIKKQTEKNITLILLFMDGNIV